MTREYALGLWDVKTWQIVRITEMGDVFVLPEARLDEDYIVISYLSGDLAVFNVKTGKVLHTMHGHTDIISATVMLDNRHLLSASDDNTLRLWNINNGRCVKVIKVDSPVRTLGLLDGGHVLSASMDKHLSIWNIEAGEIIAQYELGDPADDYPLPVSSIQVFPERDYVVVNFDSDLPTTPVQIIPLRKTETGCGFES
jgi:WD40 repeat protein